jgi:hypothetical protein
MYTYEPFGTLGVFTLLRPVFITLLLASILMFLLVITPILQTKMVNALAVIGLSVVSVILSAQLLFYNGIIVDEINLGGDPFTFYMCVAILLFNIINPIVFFITRKPGVSST